MPISSAVSRVKRFLLELRRRKVYRVGVVYAVVGFGVAQGAEYLFGLSELSDAAAKDASQIVAIVILLGLPVALVLAWAYDLRPEEPAREGARSSDPDETEAVSTAPVPGSARDASIVILPFDNISPDPADAYLAEGLTEEITASLSTLHDLRVTSRTSATVLKKSGKDTRTIGVELDVRYVLEGSVRKIGDALRITAQLIRADTDEHLWSERYDGTLADVFGMQENVARSIVEVLEVHIEPEEARRLTTRPMEDLQAYEFYLRARASSRIGQWDDLQTALEYLENARARTGENAVILAGIGYVYSQFANSGAHDRDYIGLAEEHARKSLAIDPDNPEAHMVLGFLYQEGLQDLELSLHHLERSLATKPDDPHTLTWWIIALSLAGRNQEMTTAADRLVELDPLDPVSTAMRGYVGQVTGDLQRNVEAMEAWHRTLPAGFAGSCFHAHALALIGEFDEARAILRDEFSGDDEGMIPDLARLLSAALEQDAMGMTAVVAAGAGTKLKRDLQLAFYVTTLYALAEAREETLQWLRMVIGQGFRNYPWAAEHDPWLSRYRGDPEFDELFEQMRRAWIADDPTVAST
ncbi:MAG TPA: hypothetical protein VJ925_04295 [Longimicrobiales bacterium]|nr:hypothetical protein [Longimicrobiales bacterium]